MGEFVRILKACRPLIVSLQLLQTMSIMIQNLRNEHSIYYMFSNEHINFLITYAFDFHNEELLSYYISFLRAISGKLNKNTISLLVKTQNDEVVSFPLYVEAIRFAFHEEGMIRTAVRALTLNVYHVGDEAVNRYIASYPHAEYFLNLVKFFTQQCINFGQLVHSRTQNHLSDLRTSILSAVDEIEDNLYYFSDIISAGIPDVERLVEDSMLKLLIFPLVLPSLRNEIETEIGTPSSSYLLCCIIRIVKIKDLANTVAAALLCCVETFKPRFEAKLNGFKTSHDYADDYQEAKNGKMNSEQKTENLQVNIPISSSCSHGIPEDALLHDNGGSHVALREALLSYITHGDDVHVACALCILSTLLQTKELDESMLDALGILPQRKQHKKYLLQALVGEVSGEEQLFSSESTVAKDGIGDEVYNQLEKLKDQYGVSCAWQEFGASPRGHKSQVLDSLVSLFCRSNISAGILWDGGWLLRQLLPYSETEFKGHHLKLLRGSFHNCSRQILEEAKGNWADMLITVLSEEWRNCKRVIESSSPRKDPKSMLLSPFNSMSEENSPKQASSVAAERMCEVVKVFVLIHQLHIFSLGNVLPDQPPVHPPIAVNEKSRASKAGIDIFGPKPGTEVNLVDAVPCKIAFEMGKVRNFWFLAVSAGTSGWILVAEEILKKPRYGIVRVVAPLAGCNPRIDDKYRIWLHLSIRSSSFPLSGSNKYCGHGKSRTKLVRDGRWTLAFNDEEICKNALSMIFEERCLQSNEVERRLRPLLDLDSGCNLLQESTSSRTL